MEKLSFLRKLIKINVLTDKKLLNRLLDSSNLADIITGDSKLITKMVRDKKFAKTIARKLPECKTKKDFRRVIKEYVDSYITNG